MTKEERKVLLAVGKAAAAGIRGSIELMGLIARIRQLERGMAERLAELENHPDISTADQQRAEIEEMGAAALAKIDELMTERAREAKEQLEQIEIALNALQKDWGIE